jgi:hypothetical protein
MAGNILPKYDASVAPTVTNLHSLASSQDWLTGWGSASIASDTWEDAMFGATFTTHASNRQAGSINIYVVPALNDTPLYPASATGTLGTEGTVSFVDSEERDAACVLLASITVDNTASAILALGQRAIANLFGGTMPTDFCFYVSQNASTTTTAGLAAAGSALYYTPKYSQYT